MVAAPSANTKPDIVPSGPRTAAAVAVVPKSTARTQAAADDAGAGRAAAITLLGVKADFQVMSCRWLVPICIAHQCGGLLQSGYRNANKRVTAVAVVPAVS
jgi:hypothetical protein